MRAHCLQHVPFEGLGSAERWLIATGAHLSTTRVFERAIFPPVDAVDLLVVLGGPMSVNDDAVYPWLEPERRFIREAIERGKAVLGVCLGAQLIARAMGARVYPNAEREIGWWPIVGERQSDEVPSWASAGVETTVFHWHGETFDLPPGATLLARSVGCEHQAFQLGSRVIGIQFHLETTPALVEDLVSHCGDDLAPSRFVQSASALRASSADRFVAINALMANTLEFLCSVGTSTETSRGIGRASGHGERSRRPPASADVPVRGLGLDEHTRCAHYHGPTDIVAIRFRCCGEYYACKDCHAALADHPIAVWPVAEWTAKAIRCGACAVEMTIQDYLTGESRCRACGARFNPRCRYHDHFYFAVSPLRGTDTIPGMTTEEASR